MRPGNDSASQRNKYSFCQLNQHNWHVNHRIQNKDNFSAGEKKYGNTVFLFK